MAAVMEIEAHEETDFQSRTDIIPRATIEGIVAQRNRRPGEIRDGLPRHQQG